MSQRCRAGGVSSAARHPPILPQFTAILAFFRREGGTATPSIGYDPPAGGGPDTATAVAGSVFAYVADAADENGWLYALAVRCARAGSTNPTVALGAYATSGGNPSTLLASCATFTVTAAAEAEFTRDLAASAQVAKDQSVAFAVLPTGADLTVDMAGSDYLPGADDWTFYWDDGATVLHQNFDINRTSAYEGHLSVWGLYEANVGPKAPTTVTPGSTDQANPQTIGTFAPTFAFNFADDNESLPNGLAGDSLRRGRARVLTAAGALVWDSGVVNATASQTTARQMTIDYAGSALTAGTVYQLWTSVADRFDAWSPNSTPRWFVIGAGRVDTATATPTGKTDTQTPGPFVAKWVHTGGLATNAVEVKVVNSAGSTVYASATLSMAVANNGTVSVAWSTAFPGKLLPWDDERLTWQLRARATDNNWSGWAAVSFWTNDPPKVPALVTPPQNAILTTRPLLAVTCTDTDDTATQLTVKCRIMNAAGSVLFTRTMAWNATAQRFEYQTTSTDLAGFADYLWDAYSYDGTVWSGGKTTEATAANSADRKFTYASGPVVAMTAPADGGTVTTNTFTIAWTVTGATQVTRDVQLVRAGEVIHHTNFATTAKSYLVPSLLSTDEQLHEGDLIQVLLDITDTGGLHGTAQALVLLDYPPVTETVPTVRLVNGRNDLTPSVVRITWPRSDYPADQFRYYRLERRISADMLAANPTLPDDPVVFKRFEIGQNSYDDYEATSGVAYTYRLRQYVTIGADTLASVTRTADITVLFEAAIIHDVRDPMLHRVVFDARRARTITAVTDFAVVSPWNQQKPIQFESDVYYREVDLTLVLTAKSVQAANYDLFLMEKQIKGGGILCYRDGRGNKIYGRWSSGPVIDDPPGGRLRTVRGTFRELAYDPSAKD